MSGRLDSCFDIPDRVAGQVLGNLTQELGSQSLVVVLAHFAEGSWRRDDDKAVYSAIRILLFSIATMPAEKPSSLDWLESGLPELF